jgi:8-oxo-dGTP diphosphatase
MMLKLQKLLGIIAYWLTWPATYVILSKSHRVRIIAADDNEIMLVNRWLNDGKLSLPGGGKKPGETSGQTAVREFFEETGIMLDPAKLKTVVEELLINENGVKYFVDCFFLTVDSVSSPNPLKYEILQASWIELDTILSNDKLSKSSKKLIQTWLSIQHLVD